MLRKSQLAIILLTLASGCSDSTTGPTQQSELEANRRLWTESGLTSYDFTIKLDCFCAVNGPVRAKVVDDVMSRATVIATGESVDPRWIPSITGLFDFIDRGIAGHAAVLRVTYDSTYGYPKQIVYDGNVAAADDEVTYTVTDVVPPQASVWVTESPRQPPLAAGQLRP